MPRRAHRRRESRVTRSKSEKEVSEDVEAEAIKARMTEDEHSIKAYFQVQGRRD